MNSFLTIVIDKPVRFSDTDEEKIAKLKRPEE